MCTFLRFGLLLYFSLLPQFAQVATAQEANAPDTQTLSPELLWELGRIGESTIAPNGQSIAYTVRRYDLKENGGKSSLVLRSLVDGSEKVLLDRWASIASPQWVGEGEAKLFFEGLQGKGETEEDEGENAEETDQANQAWSIDVSNGQLSQVSDFEEGIANLKVAPDGKHIAYSTDIKLDDTVNELYKDLPDCLLYTSPSPRDQRGSRMPSSA